MSTKKEKDMVSGDGNSKRTYAQVNSSLVKKYKSKNLIIYFSNGHSPLFGCKGTKKKQNNKDF